jgi:hypothetical protein
VEWLDVHLEGAFGPGELEGRFLAGQRAAVTQDGREIGVVRLEVLVQRHPDHLPRHQAQAAEPRANRRGEAQVAIDRPDQPGHLLHDEPQALTVSQCVFGPLLGHSAHLMCEIPDR